MSNGRRDGVLGWRRGRIRAACLVVGIALGGAAPEGRSMLEDEDRVNRLEFFKQPTPYPDIDTLRRHGACVGFTYKITLVALNPYGLPPHHLTQRTETGGESKTGKLIQRTGRTADVQEFDYIPQSRDPNDPPDELRFAARTLRKKQTEFDPAVGVTLTIPLHHCLDGVWSDGPFRDLEITQAGNNVQATLLNGTICDRTSISSPIFTGKINGDKLTVGDLVVCEPKDCAKAAGRAPSQRQVLHTTWDAMIDPTGTRVQGAWVQQRYEYIRNRSGKLIRCKSVRETQLIHLLIKRQGGFPFGAAPP